MPPIPPSPIKLAILDDYQGIASAHFSEFKPQFDITVFNDTLPPYAHESTSSSEKQQLINRLKPFTVISSMRERTPFTAELLHELPNLKLLLTTGVRNAAIDIQAAKKLGIPVTGTNRSSKPKQQDGSAEVVKRKRVRGPDSTTQHTVAMILALARNLVDDSLNLRTGVWQTSFATGLSGKTFATLGLGRLGGLVAKIMYESFGMEVVCWSSSLTQEAADKKAQELGLPAEDEDGDKVFKVVTKEELFRQADVLSVHYVLSERSRGIVGEQDLKLMKPSAFLVNTSRGPLVDADALFNSLEKGAIQGAAVDVFEVEPLPKESRWRSDGWGKDGRGRLLVTPHMGYVDKETLDGWYAEQADILKRWVEGKELLNVLG